MVGIPCTFHYVARIGVGVCEMIMQLSTVQMVVGNF